MIDNVGIFKLITKKIHFLNILNITLILYLIINTSILIASFKGN